MRTSQAEPFVASHRQLAQVHLSNSADMSHINGHSSTGKPGSLRDCQVASLTALLNLNPSSPSTSTSSALAAPSSNPNAPIWKVLVLDARSQEVLATTLRIQDLRDNGITLHM